MSTTTRDYEIEIGTDQYRVEDVEIQEWKSGFIRVVGWGTVEKDYPDPITGKPLWVETVLVVGPLRAQFWHELEHCARTSHAPGELYRECCQREDDDETNRTLANRKEDRA